MEKFVSKIYNSFSCIIQRKMRTRTQTQKRGAEDIEQRVQTIWLFVVRLEPKDTLGSFLFFFQIGLSPCRILLLPKRRLFFLFIYRRFRYVNKWNLFKWIQSLLIFFYFYVCIWDTMKYKTERPKHQIRQWKEWRNKNFDLTYCLLFRFSFFFIYFVFSSSAFVCGLLHCLNHS